VATSLAPSASGGVGADAKIIPLRSAQHEPPSARIAEAVDDLHRAGLTGKTIDHYALYMTRANRWCVEHGTTLDEVSPDEIRRFVAAQGMSRGSQRVVRCALQRYWTTWPRPDPPVQAIVTVTATDRSTRSVLAPHEAGALAAAALQHGERPGAAVLLALLLGLKGPQVAELRWSDFRGDGMVEVRDKAGRVSTMVVPPALLPVLARLKQTTIWLFPGNGALGHVRHETVYAWLHNAATAAGLDGVRADAFRRSRLSEEQAQQLTQGAARVAKLDRRRRPPRTDRRYLERIQTYSVELRRARLAPRTVKAYEGTVIRVERWCGEHGFTLDDVPADVLEAYVALLPQTHATLNGLHKALLWYWRVCPRDNAPQWVVRPPRKPVMVCKTLEPAEALLLEEAAKRDGGAVGAAVLVGLHQALRVSEIAKLRWDDFGSDGWMRVLGKGNLPATLPVHPTVGAALARLDRSGEWVFPGRKRGGPVAAATIWQWVRVLAEQAGLEDVTPHRLRATALATANDNTGNLRAVMAFARHSRPETTMGYTRTTARQLMSVMEAISFDDPSQARAVPDGGR
jgi:integrase